MSISTDCFLQDIELALNDFDNKLSIASYAFDIELYRFESFRTHGVMAPHTIQHSVKKRQAEFLAGRISANAALKQLGANFSDIPIGKNRCPVWPKGINAAISHTNNIALCVAAKHCDYHFIGVDIENIIEKNTVDSIASSIINQKEESLIEQSDLPNNVAFTLLFSAKESLFKALYPSVGRYFDFSAAVITDISVQGDQFSLELAEDLTETLIKGRKFNGHFSFYQEKIITLIAN